MAAGLFYGLYGPRITPYALVLYFALYPAKYKTSWRDYDPQELMQKCEDFLTWWQTKLEKPEEDQPAKRDGVTIDEALMLWMAEGMTDAQIREGGLYRMGRITDAMITHTRQLLESKQPF